MTDSSNLNNSGDSSGGNVTVGSRTHVVLAPKWLGKRVGRFKLLALLGQGAMGRVFRAEDTLMQRHVALKLLPRTVKRGQNSVGGEMLIREARAAAAIEHPGAVQIYEINEAGDVYYIAMELLEGGSLRDLVKAAGPLDPIRACLLGAEAADALAYAHSIGIVHRDIKPANLMLNRAGRCKVVDFGLARVDDPSDLSNFLAESVGTPQFISPEILTGTPASAQSDIYSLGATIWYLLCGHPPFEAGTANDLLQMHVHSPLPDLKGIRPEVPQGLADALATALAKRPADRFATMAQFAKVLRVHTIPVAGSASDLGEPVMAPPSPPQPTKSGIVRPAGPPGGAAPIQRPAATNNRSARPATPFDRPQTESPQEPENARAQTQTKFVAAPGAVKPWWMTWPAMAGGGAVVLLIAAIIWVAIPHSNTNQVADSSGSPAPTPVTPPAVTPQPAPTPGPVVIAPPPLAQSLGDFEEQHDIGTILHPGKVEYSELDHRYTLTASGDDIYGKKDSFHFVTSKISGDVTLKANISFLGSSKQKFRKAGLMIRQNLDADSIYVNAVVHGDGSISLQYRPKKGDLSQQQSVTTVKNPATLQLERRGNKFTLYAAKIGEPLKNVASITLSMKDPVYAGFAGTSHDVNTSETAIFSDASMSWGR